MKRTGRSLTAGLLAIMMIAVLMLGTTAFAAPPEDPQPSGWVQEGGKYYYYSPTDGNKLTGWLNDNGSWYYLSPADGSAQTGWVQYNNKWYYLDPYYGTVQTGWVKDNGKFYYMDLYDGTRQYGWLQLNWSWYYLSPEDGSAQAGWLEYEGNWYYLDDYYGTAKTGWIKDNGKYYYLDPYDGTVQTGWLQYNGSWYYLDPKDGTAQAGLLEVNGKTYYLDPYYGTVQTGWITIGNMRYYFNLMDGTLEKTEPLGNIELIIDVGWTKLRPGDHFTAVGEWIIKVDGSPVTDYTWTNSDNSVVSITPLGGGRLEANQLKPGYSTITIIYQGTAYEFFWDPGPGFDPNNQNNGGNAPAPSNGVDLIIDVGYAQLSPGNHFTMQGEWTIKANGTPITDYTWTNTDNSVVSITPMGDGRLLVQDLKQGVSIITITYQGVDYKFYWDYPGSGFNPEA